MRIQFIRALLVLVSLVLINPAFADQKIKTKSNIKNDRVQQPVPHKDCTNEAGAVIDCVKSEEDKSAVDAESKKSQENTSPGDDNAVEASKPE